MKTIYRHINERPIFRMALACVMGLVMTRLAAQAEDNTSTYYTNGLVNSVSGDVVVGTSGTNNYLEVSNGTTLTNSGDANISLNGTAKNNLAVVSGPGSTWNVGASSIIGFFGTDARLLITNGGVVNSTYYGIIGYYYDYVSNNVVTVTGPGSTWNIGPTYGLWVGGNGHDNKLIVENGGAVTNLGSTSMGVGAYSSNNLVLVTGTGSVFYTGGNDFGIGGGGNNRLVVANGGKVFSTNFRGFAGTNNQGNQIVITNGGFAQTIGLSFGESALNGGNSILVSGPGSVYSNTSTAIIGMSSSNNTVLVSDGGKFYTLGSQTFVGGYFGSAGAYNNITVTGSNSLWQTTGGDTYFGYTGDGNTLTISDGGRVDAFTLWTSTRTNLITVSGNGSQLNVGNYMYFNYGGPGNTMIVTNGGTVVTPGTTMGYYGDNGLIVVSGSGSVFSNTGSFAMSVFGSSNTVMVNNGGTLYSSDMAVGGNTAVGDQVLVSNGGHIVTVNGANVGNSPDNRVVISDPGSTWDLGSTLSVGFVSYGNEVVITNGGRVNSYQGVIGYNYAANSNNQVTVTAGGIWSNGLYLYIGNQGADNRLIVSDGGKVYDVSGIMGNGATASNGYAIVTGAGSEWNSSSELSVGSGAPSNALTVANGGRVNVGVTLFVGVLSANNNMTVTNGGQVFSAQGVIGYYGTPYYAGYNSVLVSGSGSVWSNSTYPIYVGLNGSSNQLVISDGGKVYTPTTYVSYGAESTNNTVLITGGGSLLRSDSSIYVGNLTGPTSGQDAHVNVLDGGTLDTPAMYSGISGSGTISNRGGIYQFPTATPTVFAGTAGGIAISNGTISYRGVAAADISNAQVGNISKSGNNAFRLNNSSNAIVASYTFDSVANTGNPTNYQQLVLINHSRWRSGNLTVGTGGGLKATAGDVVEVTGNLSILDANNFDSSFDLASASVVFSGGGNHTNAITGKDLGNDGLVGYADGFTAINYSYGTLALGSASDQIYFTSGDGATSNALYALNLDLFGNTNLVANLHAPSSINIYYGISTLAPGNAYLNDLVYHLSGGGLLMPAVPEPSAAILLTVGLGLLGLRKRKT